MSIMATLAHPSLTIFRQSLDWSLCQVSSPVLDQNFLWSSVARDYFTWSWNPLHTQGL